MSSGHGAYVFGAQYYRPPNPPAADWARDLARMRQHGMNTVKYWASWSWIHRARDVFDFDELDELMDLAAEQDLAVVINLILENAPYWLEREAPEARYHDHEGNAFTLTAAINTPGGGWPGLCFDNPQPRAAATAFLRAVVDRYQDHPALTVWDVWNEPHLEPTWYYPDRLYCYCDASVASFRHWLEERYRTVERLNQAWYRRYSDWGEVSPPRTFETYPDQLDWYEFWLWNLRRWLEWKASVVREGDSTHPLMTHVASSAYLGTLTTNIWDEWLLAEPVDLFGTSSFPRWLMNDDPTVHLFHLEMTRDAANGRPFWQAELQGGRGRREGKRSTPHPSPEQISTWVWSALATGAKGVLFWQWRPELLGPESPGYGLCTPAGEPTERSRAAQKIARLVERFPELRNSRPLPSDVAILVSRKTPLLAYASERTMDSYSEALLGAYRAFIDADVPVRLIHEDTIEAVGVPRDLAAFYWPMPAYVSDAMAAAVIEFVRAGGTVVAEAGPGQYTTGGHYSPLTPPHGLVDLFGAVVAESDVASSEIIPVQQGEGRRVQGAWLIDRLHPRGGQVIASFPDESPAVVRNHFGQGVAYLIATYPSLAYERLRDVETGSWIASLAGSRALPDRPRGLHLRIHETDDARLIFALNWASQSVTYLIPTTARLLRAAPGIDSRDAQLVVRLDPHTASLAVVEKEVQAIKTTAEPSCGST